MTTFARAAVLVAPAQIEVQEIPLPSIGDADALLRVEACGICGTDLEQYNGEYTTFPTIPGHETVGVIAEIGELPRKRWQVDVGDRVAVLPRFGCGRCEQCARASFRSCEHAGMYGFTSLDRSPSLWGGYADYQYLAAGSKIRKIRPDVPIEEAVLFNPLGAGFSWAVNVPHTREGDDVVILGCGQRGLACLIAARAAGAERVVVTGLARDAHKLALARELGADAAIDVQIENPAEIVHHLTRGAGARVVVDTTPSAPHVVATAVELAARGGIVVLAGLKGRKPVPELFSDEIVNKELTVIGVRGADHASFEQAAALIESRPSSLHRLHTHSFDLTEIPLALNTLAGGVPGADPINVAIMPGMG